MLRRGRRHGPRAGVIALAVVVVAALVAVGIFVWPGHSTHRSAAGAGAAASPSTPADHAIDDFAAAWSHGDLSTAVFARGITASAAQTAYRAIVKNLDARSVSVSATSAKRVDGTTQQATLSVRWALPGTAAWSYQTTARAENADGTWGVVWSPATIAPGLADGDSLHYTRLPATRSTILDEAGQPIFADRAVVDIGVEPSQTGDATTTANRLAAILHVNAASLASRIRSSGPHQFVDVITLRETDFIPVAAAVTAVPGVILHHLTLDLTPSHDFARSLLGTVGQVTKEMVDSSGGRYVAGDVAGLSGLQAEFDTTIGGTPGYRIEVEHSVGQPNAGASGAASAAASPGATVDDGAPASAAPPTTLVSVAPVQGSPLRTTLEPSVEAAADAAVDTITDQPSALVAVRISTGHVVAVANGPSGGGYDIGLLGQAAPGSAFKLVTTTALLEGGLDINTNVACPSSITVQGKTFTNYEGEQLGATPFHTDFAKSCNTAFISLSNRVPNNTLVDSARSLGIGACWSLGTEAFRGKVLAPKDAVDLAATSFGQGSTVVSPVSLAIAAATIARGSYLAPQLVQNGKAPDCNSLNGVAATSSAATSSAAASAGASAPGNASSPAAAGSPTASGQAAPAPIPAGVIATLHGLMREVVTSGTAPVLQKAPGSAVFAKTGTAEYGPGTPPKTHAWIVGFQGDIAFAVFVQDGQSGGAVAGPVALAFLRNLALNSAR